MSDKLPALLSGIVADAMTGFASGGASTGGAVAGISLSKLFEKRLTTARAILIEEFRRGDKTLSDVADLEEAVAITYRYARAAQEGAARLNLRLMAKVIAGQAHLGNLVADEFLYYADLLASLRREEVILIATLNKNLRSDLVNQADEKKRAGLAQQATIGELVPSLFSSSEHLKAVASATTRTGLVVAQSLIGGMAYATTPLLEALLSLASFEEALREEGIATRTDFNATR